MSWQLTWWRRLFCAPRVKRKAGCSVTRLATLTSSRELFADAHGCRRLHPKCSVKNIDSFNRFPKRFTRARDPSTGCCAAFPYSLMIAS